MYAYYLTNSKVVPIQGATGKYSTISLAEVVQAETKVRCGNPVRSGIKTLEAHEEKRSDTQDSTSGTARSPHV